MGAATVRDKIAAKIKTALLTVTPSGQVFGNGTTDAGIGPMPDVLVDATVNVLVQRGQTARSGLTGNQRYGRTFECEAKFPAFDRGEAERFVDLLDDAIRLEFSSGITLDGAVSYCIFMGSDRPEQSTDDSSTAWWSWLFRIDTDERFPQPMTP